MPNLSDAAKFDPLYTMLKGEPGTRKSTQALSYPKPQYWFSVDQKMRALLLPMRTWAINPADIEYDDYTDYNGMRKKLEACQVNCKYKTLILDSITSTADATNRQTMQAKAGEKNKDGTDKGGIVGGIRVSTLDEYKAESAAFNEIIALTKDIYKYHGCNIILIAHVIGQRAEKDSNQNTHFSRIIATGGKIISAKIPAYCEEIYHFNMEGNQYGLKTIHTGDDFARTTLPLEETIRFNNEQLYDKWIKPAISKRNDLGVK